MKIIIFGTGDYYKKYKKWFRTEDIVTLIDNDPGKHGSHIDGHCVLFPSEAVLCDYDYIIILSVHEISMREQLMSLGVDEKRIIGYSRLPQYPEIIISKKAVEIFTSENSVSDALKNIDMKKAILLMSHNLDFNGATLALYYAGKCLKNNGYEVIFASWNDGELKHLLYEDKIPVIIDSNLELCTSRESLWTERFDRIICNTLNYYYFLSDRKSDGKYVWWLHDPEMFYETIDKESLHKIDKNNLKVYAAGSIAQEAIQKYIPDIEVGQLMFGLPEVSVSHNYGKVLEMAVIANVQEYKGQDILIEALKELIVEEQKIIHVRIIGNQESVFATNLKEIAHILNETVEFIPPIDRGSIQKILNELDVLVCPSRVDTMSISAVEAMQNHVPCIVSDATGISDYIEDGENGFIFKNENSTELAEKIRWCINNRTVLRTMGNKARKIYEKYFTMDFFSERLLDIVSNLFES